MPENNPVKDTPVDPNHMVLISGWSLPVVEQQEANNSGIKTNTSPPKSEYWVTIHSLLFWYSIYQNYWNKWAESVRPNVIISGNSRYHTFDKVYILCQIGRLTIEFSGWQFSWRLHRIRPKNIQFHAFFIQTNPPLKAVSRPCNFVSCSIDSSWW